MPRKYKESSNLGKLVPRFYGNRTVRIFYVLCLAKWMLHLGISKILVLYAFIKITF